MMTQAPTICPELLAAKLHRIRNLEDPELSAQIEGCPRLMEALWFIQDASHQPGSLEALSTKLRLAFPDAFATRAMRAAGLGGRWNLEQCVSVWRSCDRAYNKRWGHQFHAWLDSAIDDASPAQQLGEAALLGVERYNQDFFAQRCAEAAANELPRLLAEWCEPGITLRQPWWCPELLAILCAFMDRHSAEMENGIAPTKIKQQVFRELAFSMSERVPVQIVGNSRFGKTRSVSAICAMRPGRARLVTVPPENRQRDFLLAIADALHYQPKRGISHAELDRVIQFIVRHSGLFFIWDESQFLIPSSYTTQTKPARLNWIRSHMIDAPGAGGCAFFSTKQSYNQDLAQFVKRTGFVMEQWLGRMAPIVTLPGDVDREDLLAIAMLNFPDIPEFFLERIAARAKQSEGLLHHIEITAKRARFIAREAGRTGPILADVEAAIAEMLPGDARPLPAARAAAAAPAPHTRIPDVSEPSAEPRNRLSVLEPPVRSGG